MNPNPQTRYDSLKGDHLIIAEGIMPVINPFWSFVLCIMAVHYFCFSLWPIVYWKICVAFNLLDRLTGREFLNIASRISFSAGIMLFFFFFAAGYNTTNKGATQQRNEPFPIYRLIVTVLNKSIGLTVLIWLLIYGFLFFIKANGNTEFFDGSPLPDMEAKASEVFSDFQVYYRIFGPAFYHIYIPFNFFSVFILAGVYFWLLLCMTNNKLPFFVIIEPLNKHFWQRFQSVIRLLKKS